MELVEADECEEEEQGRNTFDYFVEYSAKFLE